MFETEISLTEQLECVDRELSMRGRVYPRWVLEKKLTQALADKEMARMRAVRHELLVSAARRRLLDQLMEQAVGGESSLRSALQAEIARWEKVWCQRCEAPVLKSTLLDGEACPRCRLVL